MIKPLLSLILPLFLLTACQEEPETVKAQIAAIVCPSGYSLVAENYDLSTNAFCLSKDLMALNAKGNLTVRSGSLYAVTSDYSSAVSACQSLGSGYDLVNLKEYQAAAREVELLDENWQNGYIGGGIFAYGKTSVKLLSGDTLDGVGNNFRNSYVDATMTWIKDYFYSYYTYGYDFDVKAGEYYTRTYPLVLSNFPYDDSSRWFAPKGNYFQNEDILLGGDAGLGELNLNSGPGYIVRGGFTKYPYQAEFHYFASSSIGFHCVYHP